jgi:CRISPR-associated protein Csb2
LGDEVTKPLEWLEELAPPVIGAPHMTLGMTIPMHFVPNNDLDAHGGHASKLGRTRTAFKVWKPKLFDQEARFLYAWAFDETDGASDSAQLVCHYADRMYQLGRGIDLAWATGEVTEPQKLEELLIDYRGVVYQPGGGRDGTVLACPQKGSLQSLKVRYAAMSGRFTARGQGRAVKLQFAQAPKPRFAPTAYGSAPNRRVFELRTPTSQADFAAWPLTRISDLVVGIRDRVVAKLKTALPEQESQIEKCLVGRKADGRDDAPKAARVRILPLPSIGHGHADHAIRRVLVEVPALSLVSPGDVYWAFSGLDIPAPAASESVLVPSDDLSMLGHYGIGEQVYRLWRTVTPVVLPESAARRRIDPLRRAAEAKPGSERAVEQVRAAAAVVQALRHAEILARVDTIRVQREPFESKGERAQGFAPGTRFAKERLWHVEIAFHEPLTGPLVIGDGRYYGLGLMAPARELEDR